VPRQSRDAATITTAITSGLDPTSGDTSAPSANWSAPSSAEPVPAMSRTSREANALALPMMKPRLVTARKRTTSTGHSDGPVRDPVHVDLGPVVSAEDFAVALIDEVEKPAHRRTRFTVAN
jgi:hypothetical protein